VQSLTKCQTSTFLMNGNDYLPVQWVQISIWKLVQNIGAINDMQVCALTLCNIAGTNGKTWSCCWPALKRLVQGYQSKLWGCHTWNHVETENDEWKQAEKLTCDTKESGWCAGQKLWP
jgi:hypothetical protein